MVTMLYREREEESDDTRRLRGEALRRPLDFSGERVVHSASGLNGGLRVLNREVRYYIAVVMYIWVCDFLRESEFGFRDVILCV